ncbi:MAG: efflux RND transporter periplasmic adaptor subunit [Planctomycetota bacterium]|nr:efflux RND transporter periplasmic adaptor subunit [Planctomycetota bacterium]
MQTSDRKVQLTGCLSLLGGTLLFLNACGPTEQGPSAPPPPPVTVATPEVRQVTEWLDFTGTTAGVQTANMIPRVSGHIVKIAFEEGSVVDEGQLLYEIDPRTYQAEVDQAVATLAARVAEMDLAKVVLQRVEDAHEKGGTSEIEVLEHQAKRDQAVATVAMAQASLDAAQLDLDFTKISAPFKGRIALTNADVGNLVGPMSPEPLATIIQIQPIHAYFTMSEQDLVKIMGKARSTGQPIKDNPDPTEVHLAIGAGGEYVHEGIFDFASNTIDPNTGTILLRSSYPNENLALLPGLFVRLRTALGDETSALLVPDQALGADQRGRFLYTITEENLVEYRHVAIGQLVDGMRVILEGITEQDRVVVEGMMRCRPGLSVNPSMISSTPDSEEAHSEADS